MTGRCRTFVLLVGVLLGVGGMMMGCASDSTSDAASSAPADSAATSAVTDAEPAPNPAAPTDLEKQADQRSVGQKLEDASLETRVKRSLVKTSALRVFPFRPTVINGHLILRGDVNTADQYAMAARVGRRVDGIESVTNRLTMGGRPVTEERLESDDGLTGDDDAVYHTVRAGDTLWDIARQYRSSVQQIRNLNDFRSSNLRPGQRIRVR